ncbi:FAD-binding protein [Ferrovibrio sp.]|uniref:FAD-binding oxidoreductase n=1 Tax=Ferrovibrio sp. TaxID=1917215 RepID=UPI003D0B9BBF
MRLAGWGNYPHVDCRVISGAGLPSLRERVTTEPSLIARGNGRSYGDAALNQKATLLTRGHDHIIAFEPDSGLLVAESGLLLGDLIDIFIPRGWFPPVTPGTRWVSLGGMVAADVHGKNHHGAGSFCNHVESLELILADGTVVSCSRSQHADLFAATCGGMGLTGLISSLSFRLKPIRTAWIRQQTMRCANLAEAMAQIEAARHWTYSVAWIDCLSAGPDAGRCLLYLGEHAEPDELDAARRATPLVWPTRRSVPVPVNFPEWVLNGFSLRAFNEVYYRAARPGSALVDWQSYFYPLDRLSDWNRIYGRSGLLQYQCVLPGEASAAGLGQLLRSVARAGMGAFLAVLKQFGDHPGGDLSFPMAGYTLAMDFPMRPRSLALLNELDAIVADHGGRLYLAKDARMTAAMLRKGYAGLERFQALRHRSGAASRFTSRLAERLEL